MKKYLVIFIFLTVLISFVLKPFGASIQSLIPISIKSINFGFWFDIWSAFFAATLFTIILFILSEFIWNDPELTGEWHIIEKVEMASVYVGYEIHYKVHILQKGYEFFGSGEKTFEFDEKENLTEFNPEISEIVTFKIAGYISRNYIKKSKIQFVKDEEGIERNTTGTYSLRFKGNQELVGTFSSTAANSYGIVRMKKRIS